MKRANGKALTLALLTAVGCGGAKTSSDRSGSAGSGSNGSAPSDSNGRTGGVAVSFGLAVIPAGTGTPGTSPATPPATPPPATVGATTPPPPATPPPATVVATTPPPPATPPPATVVATTPPPPAAPPATTVPPAAVPPATVPAVTVKAEGTVGIDTALFNIAKLKIRANREENDDEKRCGDQENDAEKVSVTKLERDGDASDNGGASHKAASGHEAKSGDDHGAKLADSDDGAEPAACRQAKGDDDHEARIAGPYLFDAVSGKFDGDAPKVDLADGSYRRIEFQLKRSQDDRLFGDVFLIRGSVQLGGKAVPFEVTSHVAMNFRLRGDGAFTVTAGVDNELKVILDSSKWFTGVDFAKAAVDEDGTIYLNRTANRAMAAQVRRNIKVSAGFGKAEDDGKLKIGAEHGDDAQDADID